MLPMCLMEKGEKMAKVGYCGLGDSFTYKDQNTKKRQEGKRLILD